MNRILVIRRDNIGDLVCTTPFIHALRRQLPTARIDALVTDYNAAVLAGNPDLDTVHSYQKAKHRGDESALAVYLRRLRTVLRLRRARYDLAVLPGGEQASAIRFARLCGARRIVVRDDSDITKPADVKGRAVGGLVASNWTKIAEELGADVKTYKAESDGMQDLANGNIDAVITDSIAAAYAIKVSNLPLKLVEEPVSSIQKGFAIKKGKPKLVAAINKALGEMIADGTYAKLTTDLIGVDPAPKEPIRTLAQ